MTRRAMTYRVVREARVGNGRWEQTIVSSPTAAAALLIPELARQDVGREHLAVLFLDVKRRPIAVKTLFSGTLEKSVISPGVIARDALLLGATSVVLAHNHPSGDVTPSDADRQTTRGLKKALAMVEVQLLDHLVVAGERWQSADATARKA